MRRNSLKEPPRHVAVFVYISFAVLYVFGFLRSCLKAWGVLKIPKDQQDHVEGFVPLYNKMEKFYANYMFRRCQDCWSRTVLGSTGTEIKVFECINDFENCRVVDGDLRRTINTGSYNYLGFGQLDEENFEYLTEIVDMYGYSPMVDDEKMKSLRRELEVKVAQFVGAEECVCFGMGFGTNSYNINVLVDSECCIISDEMNHASLIVGIRISKAHIRVFKHNDIEDLETILKELTVKGQPKTSRPWKKILIIVEGLYSMEGSFVDLPEVVKLKKKYKAYLYVDEAHSIGALGKEGKGIVDYYGIDSKDVDILMGTFTKSFGATGGYIASTKDVISTIRKNSSCYKNAQFMSPVIIGQILYSLSVIEKETLENLEDSRVEKLRRNTKYLRDSLTELGFIIQGEDASPVIPLMIYLPHKMVEFCRRTHRRGVSTVVVCFPATSVTTARCRLCVSASHTREQLDQIIQTLSTVGDELLLKYAKSWPQSLTRR